MINALIGLLLKTKYMIHPITDNPSYLQISVFAWWDWHACFSVRQYTMSENLYSMFRVNAFSSWMLNFGFIDSTMILRWLYDVHVYIINAACLNSSMEYVQCWTVLYDLADRHNPKLVDIIQLVKFRISPTWPYWNIDEFHTMSCTCPKICSKVTKICLNS